MFLLAVTTFGCDHATKLAAAGALAGGRVVPVYDGIVELRYAENRDVAFTLLGRLGVDRGAHAILAASVAALVGVAVAWIVAARRGASSMQHVAFAAVLAGALGNVVDRALRGYVIDFIHVARWPIFNVADIAVCVGAGALLLLALLARRRGSAAT